MAIEGPLRELGIHDVFQLLDLSRKTGRLRVTSALRDNEGAVFFENGRVIAAGIRSNPHPLGEVLLKAGKISEADLERARAEQAARGSRQRLGEILVAHRAVTPRELERHVRAQIEAVVFELMSWQEGFFRFEEGDVGDAPTDFVGSISTESLLMEGARRIDEWARIAPRIAHMGMVPVLASLDDDHPSQLDLLPNEWAVLAMIDGVTDLRGIAERLGRSDFEVARIAYGLVTTDVIEVRPPEPQRFDGLGDDDAGHHLARARGAMDGGRYEEALAAAGAAVSAAPQSADPRLLLARALTALGRHDDALEEARRAAAAEPARGDVQRALGAALVRAAALDGAIAAWQHYLVDSAGAEDATQVAELVEAAARLRDGVGALNGV
ncbi:MAG TPA: DUF4388 domain-containing protein [Gemmatimonadaceae bacterium]|nr:DUF4388 domain-containing protein [Gemmatimonadaceae bacterium]